jgi:GTPase SAR1 family protein
MLTRTQTCLDPQAPMYYRGANAALLLYDITNQVSFQDVQGWLKGVSRQEPRLNLPNPSS